MKYYIDKDTGAIISPEDDTSNCAVSEFTDSEILAIKINYKKDVLNAERNKELETGVIVSDVFMNEDIIKTMAVQHNIVTDDEVIEWIDINNQTVTFSKVDFGALIKAGSQKVKEIYFKYRALKNELEEA